MGAFEDIVATFGPPPSVHPSTYKPQGDGYYSNGIPCAHCGSLSVVLDDTPACVVCTDRIESMRVAAELALAQLDQLLAVAPLLPTAQKAELHGLALMANVQVQRLLLAVARG